MCVCVSLCVYVCVCVSVSVSVCACVSRLIKETYFEIGNLLFKQCIGLPMGIDPAPFWANLHLYAYEYKFMTTFLFYIKSLISPQNHGMSRNGNAIDTRGL